MIAILEACDEGKPVKYKKGHDRTRAPVARINDGTPTNECFNVECFMRNVPRQIIENICGFLDNESLQSFGATCRVIYGRCFRQEVIKRIQVFMTTNFLKKNKKKLSVPLEKVKPEESYTPLTFAYLLYMLKNHNKNHPEIPAEESAARRLMECFQYGNADRMLARQRTQKHFAKLKADELRNFRAKVKDERLAMLNQFAWGRGLNPDFHIGVDGLNLCVKGKKVGYGNVCDNFVINVPSSYKALREPSVMPEREIEQAILDLADQGILERIPVSPLPSAEDCQACLLDMCIIHR
jgi:hypothetical protein